MPSYSNSLDSSKHTLSSENGRKSQSASLHPCLLLTALSTLVTGTDSQILINPLKIKNNGTSWDGWLTGHIRLTDGSEIVYGCR